MKDKKGRIILVSLLTLGFTSTFTQIYLLREFLSVLNGNELVIGIVLSSWMLLTGAGAYLGRFFHKIRGRLGFIVFLQFLLTILPFLTVLKLDLWRSVSLPYGSMAELKDIIYVAFTIQLPFCMINGFLFSVYSVLAEEYSGKSAGISYTFESLGSVVGGMIVNFILLWLAGLFLSLKILLAVNMLSTFLFAIFLCRKWTVMVLIIASLVLIPSFFLMDFQKLTDQWLYPKQQLICERSTPYGKVVVTKNAGQLNFYENDLLLFSSGNEILSEEAVHYAMVQHPSPLRILLVSGGITGMIDEIRKYNPQRIDYLEMNPSLTEIGRSFMYRLHDPVVSIYNIDARRFLESNLRKYDVALINLLEPSTLQINRYYTTEFFSLLKEHLNPGAVISISLASTADYVSEPAGKMNGSLLATLKNSFLNVLIIPGMKNYFIASDGPLFSHVARSVAQRRIPTVYANSDYVDDQLLKQRTDFIVSRLPAESGINYDFSPVIYFYQLQYWTSYFTTDWLLILIILVVILLLVFLSLDPVSFGLFAGGFTASSLSIMIILAFQVFYGYVFGMAGVLIMLFMAGLAAGSFTGNKLIHRSTIAKYITIQFLVVLFTLGFPFTIIWLHTAGVADSINYMVLGSLTLLISFLAGLEYCIASSLYLPGRSHIVSRNYSADLFGSSLGALLTSVVMLPLAGLVYSSLILALMNLVSIFILIIAVSAQIRRQLKTPS
jgi:spermidine synthase